MQLLDDNKWIVDLLPGIVAFFLPSSIIITSYAVIWKHIKSVKGKQRSIATVEQKSERTLSQIEWNFIRTVFSVCLFYIIAAFPLALAKMFPEIRTPSSMLLIISLMLSQYIVNFIVYAYRSEQYRSAYWDVLIIICPKLKKFQKE